MTDIQPNARELAYQLFINEVTPNGNSRLDNIILCNTGPKAEQHIATQVDMAFQAGWRAALAAVRSDIKAKRMTASICPACGMSGPCMSPECRHPITQREPKP